MTPPIDRGYQQSIAQTIKAQRPRHGNHMPAIHQPTAKAAFSLSILIEMHLGCILIQPRRHHVIRLLNRHTIDVINLLADFIITPHVSAAGQFWIETRKIQPLRHMQLLNRHNFWQIRHINFRGRRIHIAFAHHHPAHIFQHNFITLINTRGTHINHTGFTVGVFFQPNHFGRGRERIAGKHGLEEFAIRVAQIGDRIERNVRHSFTKHNMERQHVVYRGAIITNLARHLVRRLQRKPCGEQRRIKRDIPSRDRTRRRVRQHLANFKVFKEIARIGFCSHVHAPHDQRISPHSSPHPARQVTVFWVTLST